MFEVIKVNASWEALQKFDPTIAVMMYAFLEVLHCDDIVYQFRKFNRPVEISDELLKEEETCSKTPDDPLDQLVLCCDVVDP